MQHTFKEIFGEGIFSDDAVNSAVVSGCELDIQNRTLTLNLQSDTYISDESVSSIKRAITKALGLNHLDLSISFNRECFCLDACKDIAARLRRRSAMLNGYFNKAEY